jgi:undecaprenyl-diphosphatase
VGAAICTPLVVWQVKGGFASVLFQWRHGTGGGERSLAGSLKTFGEFVGGQFGAVTPIIFVLVVWALVKGVARLVRRWRGREDVPQPDDALLPCLVFPAAAVLLVFGAASLMAESEVNWPAAAYPTLCVLLGVDLARWAAGTRARKVLAYSGLVLAAALSAYVHVEAVCPIFPYKGAPFDKVPDRTPLARWAEATIASRGPEGRAAPVLASSYQLASVLAFYLPGNPRTDAPFERGSGAQYVAWGAGRALAGGTRAWYFTRTKNDFGMERLFEEYEFVDKLSDLRLGVEIEHYRAFYGRVKEGYAGDVGR